MHATEIHGFTRDLDDHPLLDWAGGDLAHHVARSLLRGFAEQDAGTRLLRLEAGGPPEMTTTTGPDGTVRGVAVAVALALLVCDGAGRRWRMRGTGRFHSDGRTTFDLDATEPFTSTRERLRVLLDDVDAAVARPGNSFLYAGWEDAAGAHAEIAGFRRELTAGPADLAGLGAIFLPTASLQELAAGSGWGGEYLTLADRFDAICADDADPAQLELILDDGWTCGTCRGDAGTLILRASAGRGDLQVASGGTARTLALDPGAFATVHAALDDADLPALHALDPSYVPFWCPACDAVRCAAHACAH